jgi:hypothetical protein
VTASSSIRLGLCALLVIASGCATSRQSPAGFDTGYQPNNVYRANIRLPLDVRRVAVLPVSVEAGDWQADAGRTLLESVLLSELAKCKTFETVLVSPEQMKSWTHRASWRADEALPAELLNQVRQTTGCDAILFAHLRPYHAYEPLVIGWNLKLAEARSGAILWSADEVFDAAEIPVARTAVAYQRRHVKSAGDASEILSSPRLFGQYTLSALLATLPSR